MRQLVVEDRIINKDLLVKRINLVAGNVIDKNKVKDLELLSYFEGDK